MYLPLGKHSLFLNEFLNDGRKPRQFSNKTLQSSYCHSKHIKRASQPKNECIGIVKRKQEFNKK